MALYVTHLSIFLIFFAPFVFAVEDSEILQYFNGTGNKLEISNPDGSAIRAHRIEAEKSLLNNTIDLFRRNKSQPEIKLTSISFTKSNIIQLATYPYDKSKYQVQLNTGTWLVIDKALVKSNYERQVKPLPVLEGIDPPLDEFEKSVERVRLPKLTVVHITSPIEVVVMTEAGPETRKIKNGDLTVIQDHGDVVHGILKNSEGVSKQASVNINAQLIDTLIANEAKKPVDAPIDESESIIKVSDIDNKGHTPSQIKLGEEYMVPPGGGLSTQNANGKAVIIPPGSIVKVTRGTGFGKQSWGYEVQILASEDRSLNGLKLYTSAYNFELLELLMGDDNRSSVSDAESEASPEEVSEVVNMVINAPIDVKEILSPSARVTEACSENMFTLENLSSFRGRSISQEQGRYKQSFELEAYLSCYNQANTYYQKEAVKNYRSWIKEAAAVYGLPEAILACQIMRESKFNPNAQSPYALGIAQFTPATIKTLNGFLFNTNVTPEKIADLENKMTAFIAAHGNDSARWTTQQKKDYELYRSIYQRTKVISEGKKEWARYFKNIGKTAPTKLIHPDSAKTPHIAIAASAFYMKYILKKLDFELNFHQGGSFSERDSSDKKKNAAQNLSLLDLTIVSTGMYNAGPNALSRVFIANSSGNLESMVTGARSETRGHMRSIKKCAESGNMGCMDGESDAMCDKYKKCFKEKMDSDQ